MAGERFVEIYQRGLTMLYNCSRVPAIIKALTLLDSGEAAVPFDSRLGMIEFALTAFFRCV